MKYEKKFYCHIEEEFGYGTELTGYQHVEEFK